MLEKRIYKKILIEKLIAKYPDAATFLMKKGIRCVVCGEPLWGTLEQAALGKGFNEKEVENLIDELNISIIRTSNDFS